MAEINQTQSNRTTEVDLINRNGLWAFIVILLAPFIGLYLFTDLRWWMSISLIAVAVIQIIGLTIFFGNDVLNDKTHRSKIISVDEIDYYTKKEKKLTKVLQSLFVLAGLLDLYPFFCQSGLTPLRYYEGGIIVTLLSLVLCAFWIWGAYELRKPRIIENYELFHDKGKTREEVVEEQILREQRETARKQEQKKEKYGEGFIDLGGKVVINDNTKKIFINNHQYVFSDILGFSVQDNAVTIHSESISTAKTDTGSMLGRAAVGGVLFGGTGAIIGGATAKQNIEHSAYQSSVLHNYSIVVTVNRITSPNEIVKIGQDEETLNKITSTLAVILHQNK